VFVVGFNTAESRDETVIMAGRAGDSGSDMGGNSGSGSGSASEGPRDIEEARRLLAQVSAEEVGQGVTVGVLLLQKSSAGEFKKRFTMNYGEKIGFKRVKVLPALDPYLVVHLSPRSALDLQRVIDSEDKDELLKKLSPFEFFAGVRMAHDIFGFEDCRLSPTISDDNAQTAPFTFAEVFAGIGGFRLGLEAGLGGRCAFASELDAAARSTYALNFGTDGLLGDVTDLYAHQFPDHDILTGGFPCQSFSDRGEQKGLDDPRGQLYTELVRILIAKQPRAFLFENVASLVTMTGGKRNRVHETEQEGLVVGRTFRTILEAFEVCGYNVSHHIIDARHFVPQHRERVYIVGYRRDLGVLANGFGWPEAEADLLRKAGVTFPSQGGSKDLVSASASRVRDILEDEELLDPKLTLTAAQWARVQASQADATDQWRRLGGNARSRLIDLNGKAPTLTSGYKNAASVSTRFVSETKSGMERSIPRFLSPRECCRVMGFPEDFQIPQASRGGEQNLFYKQIGNAVCPPVIKAVGEIIIRHLQCGDKTSS
jgi:DNA (cytosine-5)-methyltransferase 1